MNKTPYLIATALMLAASMPAVAEKADKEKPINLEADRVSMEIGRAHV